MARNYAKEYADYHSKPEQIKNRAARNKARADKAKEVGKSALSGKDVGHKKALISGGSNSKSNTRVESVKSNRGWRSGKSGRGSYTP